jgi:hypothetical protein
VEPVLSEREPAAFGISPKTARAVADPWRLRILTEVGSRPLSPSQFVDRFGGELTHVARCFRQLAKWGYIEVAQERPGRRSGAAIEHVYRAIQMAHFDTSAWEDIPQGERNAASRSVLSAFQHRVRAAVEAGTFDLDANRHLSWDTVALDRRSWVQLGERLDAILSSLVDHELGAAERLAAEGEDPLPIIVGLAAFRSPESPSRLLSGAYRQAISKSGSEAATVEAIGFDFAKALSNRWRCQIVSEVGIRPLSPSQFVEKFGGSMTHVSRCFRELAEWGFLEIFEERNGGRRGGGVERVYRSTRRPYFDTPTWEALPPIVRSEISSFVLDTYFARINEAIREGTFDADPGRHLSWKPVLIDWTAWLSIGEDLDDVLAWLPELETESLERTENTESLIPTTIGLSSFRSPSSRHTRSDV